MNPKRKPLYFFILALYGLFGFAPTGSAQDISSELVQRSLDDFSGAITTMVQDKQGFLWLGSNSALFKYDGQRYINYTHDPTNPNSPADFAIWGLHVDRDGAVWILPGGFGLDRFDPGTGIFTHYRHDEKDSTSLSHDAATALLVDRDGTLWVGTSAGLDQFDKTTKTFKHYRNRPNDPTSLSGNGVRVIYEDRQGAIWVGTGDPYTPDRYNKTQTGGLNKFDKRSGTFKRYEHDDNDAATLADNRVQVIYEDSHGTFWVGTAGDGLHTLNRTTGKFQRHAYDPTHPNKLSRPPVRNRFSFVPDYVTFITEDASGRVWIGTLGGAISIYDPVSKMCEFYDVHDDGKGNLNGAGYWAAFQTSDKTMWISTTTNELFKIKPHQSPVPHVQLNKGVIRFTQDEYDNLWIGTTRGLVKQSVGGKRETIWFDGDSTSAANTITQVILDKDRIWAASSGGLHTISRHTMAHATLRHSSENNKTIASDNINFLAGTDADRLWVGTADAGLDLFDIKTLTFRHFANNRSDTTSLSNNRLLSIAKDRNNNTWIGTFLGLNKLDTITNTFKRYLKPLAIISLHEDHSGQLWCGTDAGLFKYNEEKDEFVKFMDKSALISPSMVVGSLIEDRHDNLWFISPQKGIVRLNKARDFALSIGFNQGVNKQVLFGDAFISNSGALLVGDTSGYFIIQTDDIQRKASAPIVNIDNFLLNDVPAGPGSFTLEVPLSIAKQLNLRHDENTFSFEFTAIDFISEPEDTRVLYHLENYDNGWRQAEDKRTAYYFNLLPGHYVFKVKAISAEGIEAQKEIGVIIHPPWWKTGWAYGAFAVCAATIAYLLYRNRIRQLQVKQTEQMMLMVATQEGERKRISRDLHDDIGTKLSAVKLSLSSLGEKARDINDDDINTLAKNSEQFITEVMQDVRQLLLNLSPTLLEEFGYTTAVEALVGKINETKKIHFDLVIFGWENPIHKDYELALYRITQELINNVIRHAEATNVSLQIGRRDSKIILMIEDNGKGFDVTAHRDGYGLRNLDTRTKLMNGTMIIDSQLNKGSSIMIEVPYNFN